VIWLQSLRKNTLCGLGVKTPYSLQSGDRVLEAPRHPKSLFFRNL
jgi:hypothetical protein